MQGDEARVLLGFPPNSWPTVSQVKAAYKRKVWESHPDLFPFDKKTDAESKFKAISEAYTCLLSDPDFMSAQADFGTDLAICNRTELDPGVRGKDLASATSVRVVRTGVPMANGGRRNHALIGIPFLFIIFGTVGLGGLNATRAYKKQKEAYPSHNPFLP